MNKNCVTLGEIYKSVDSYYPEANFIVTAVGLNHVLIAAFPLIKLMGNYLEYCVTRQEFESKFELSGETK